MGGGWCCLAERRTKAHGSKCRPRKICNNDASYQKSLSKISTLIQTSFEQAVAYTETTFAPFRQIYLYGRNWSNVSIIEKDDWGFFFREMSLMRTFQEDLEKFRAHHLLSFFLLDAKKLKTEVLAPVPEQGLAVMKDCLKGIAKVEDFHGFFFFTVKIISVVPSRVESRSKSTTVRLWKI